jgi:hypothetical protein
MFANRAQTLLGIQRPLKNLRRLVPDDPVEAERSTDGSTGSRNAG